MALNAEFNGKLGKSHLDLLIVSVQWILALERWWWSFRRYLRRHSSLSPSSKSFAASSTGRDRYRDKEALNKLHKGTFH